MKNLGENLKTWGIKMRNTRENAALERQLKQAAKVRTQARTAAQKVQTQTQEMTRHFSAVQDLLSNRENVSRATEHSLQANKLEYGFRTLLKQRPHDAQLRESFARAKKLRNASNVKRKAALQSSSDVRQSLHHSASSRSNHRSSL